MTPMNSPLPDALAAELRMLALSAINDDLSLTLPMSPERARHVHRFEALLAAADMIDRLALQVRQADERGDEAMRRAHAAEAKLAAILNPASAAEFARGIEAARFAASQVDESPKGTVLTGPMPPIDPR